MKIDSDLIRALYDVPAYRGSTSEGATARGGWWANLPEEANHYTDNPHTQEIREGANVIPGQLNTRGFQVVEGKGAPYSHIPGSQIPEKILARMAEHFGLTYQQAAKREWKTDDVAQAVEELNLPGVTFRNFQDQMDKPTTQYFVADPRRRRSRFAKFEDPNSEDLMAGLVLSLMGGGAGAAALSQRDPDGT